MWTKVEVVHEGIKLPRKGFVSIRKLSFAVNISGKKIPSTRSENEGKYEISTAKPICFYSSEMHQSISNLSIVAISLLPPITLLFLHCQRSKAGSSPFPCPLPNLCYTHLFSQCLIYSLAYFCLINTVSSL